MVSCEYNKQIANSVKKYTKSGKCKMLMCLDILLSIVLFACFVLSAAMSSLEASITCAIIAAFLICILTVLLIFTCAEYTKPFKAGKGGFVHFEDDGMRMLFRSIKSSDNVNRSTARGYILHEVFIPYNAIWSVTRVEQTRLIKMDCGVQVNTPKTVDYLKDSLVVGKHFEFIDSFSPSVYDELQKKLLK